MGSLESAGRVLLSLAFVLGLMWLIGKWARNRGKGGRGRNRDGLAVLARQQLTRNSSVAVIKVAGRAMVLGITDGQVRLLADTELTAFEPAVLDLPAVNTPKAIPLSTPITKPRATGRRALEGSALSPATWTQALDALRERTVRR